jgi:hypothetical protein
MAAWNRRVAERKYKKHLMAIEPSLVLDMGVQRMFDQKGKFIRYMNDERISHVRTYNSGSVASRNNIVDSQIEMAGESDNEDDNGGDSDTDDGQYNDDENSQSD